MSNYVHLCNLLLGKRVEQRFKKYQTKHLLSPTLRNQSSSKPPRLLRFRFDKKATKDSLHRRCPQGVENETDPRVPPVPQDHLQIQNEEAKIRALGWYSASTNHAILGR